MQALVPSYLEHSMQLFTKEQQHFREHVAKAMSGNVFGAMQDQARHNMEVFQEAFRLFNPYAAMAQKSAAKAGRGRRRPDEARPRADEGAPRQAGQVADIAIGRFRRRRLVDAASCSHSLARRSPYSPELRSGIDAARPVLAQDFGVDGKFGRHFFIDFSRN